MQILKTFAASFLTFKIERFFDASTMGRSRVEEKLHTKTEHKTQAQFSMLKKIQFKIQAN